MSQPKIACVYCNNWIPPKADYNTVEFIDAKCKVEECCPTYVNRSKMKLKNLSRKSNDMKRELKN